MRNSGEFMNIVISMMVILGAFYLIARMTETKNIRLINQFWNTDYVVNQNKLVNPSNGHLILESKCSGISPDCDVQRLFKTRNGSYGIFRFYAPLNSRPHSEVSMISESEVKDSLIRLDIEKYRQLFGEPFRHDTAIY